MPGVNVFKQPTKYDDKIITIRDRQGNEQKVSMNVFIEGMAIAIDDREVLSIFDSDKNTKLDNNEVYELKKAIVKAAGRDKILDDDEILKIFNLDKDSKNAKSILTQFKIMVERQFKGNLETTVNIQGGTLSSNFNSDGSGKTIKKQKGQTITCYYEKGKILVKQEIYDENKKIKTTKIYKNNEQGKPITVETKIVDEKSKTERNLTTSYQYNSNGQVVQEIVEEHLDNINVGGRSIPRTKKTTTQYEYNEDGKKIKTTITDSGRTTTIEYNENNLPIRKVIKEDSFFVDNGKLFRRKNDTIYEYSYYDNGRIKETKMRQVDSSGKETLKNINYNQQGNIVLMDRSYYKRGAFIEEHYEGANINNRIQGNIPSVKIEYTDGTKTTVKQKTIYIFDEDGILIGEEIYDKDGTKISYNDFSKINGKFNTAYQGSRGDCYLLAAINSLASTPEGENMLNKTISKDGDNYVITFPGAIVARDNLIEELKKRNPSFDISKINIPEKYTITPEELHQAMLKAGSKYSIGDKDVLLLEIAYEKYRTCVAETLESNGIKPSFYLQGFSLNNNHIKEGDYLSSGTTQEAIFILTGKKSDVYYSSSSKVPTCYVDSDYQMHVADENGQTTMHKATASPYNSISSEEQYRDDLINKLIQDCKDGHLDEYAANVSINVSSQEVNGKVINGGGHALTIKYIDSDKVILSNPWSPDTDVVMSMEDFKKAAYRITVTTLVETNSNNNEKPPINNNNTPPQQNPSTNNRRQYIVKKGEGYIRLLKRELENQGIKPTSVNIQKASAQFKAANPGAVHVYNGKKAEWKGNEYLLANAKVIIPQFQI